jgi:hypothetical protein
MKYYNKILKIFYKNTKTKIENSYKRKRNYKILKNIMKKNLFYEIKLLYKIKSFI